MALANRLSMILWYAQPMGIANTEAVLGFCTFMIHRFEEPINRLLIILWDTGAQGLRTTFSCVKEEIG